MEDLNEYKKIVLKKYPLASVKMYNETFYVTDGNGNKVIPDDFYVNNSKSIYLAWKNAAIAVEIKPTIDRNTYKFCDDKIYESYSKKNKDKCSVDE
jgi:hypothetical protein